MTRCQLVSILSAIAASATLAGTAVTPYVTEREVFAGEFAGQPGRLAATTGEDDATNSLAYLVWADPAGGVRPVSDPYALHRRRVWRIDPPDWYADPDPGVECMPGDTYLLLEDPVGRAERSVTVRPAEGYRIVRLAYTVVERSGSGMGDPWTVTDVYDAPDGSAKITGSTSGSFTPHRLAVRIDAVFAERMSDAAFRDDLTMGDYHFRDALGETSLGGLRRWTVNLTTNRLAQNWARYPAERAVRLAGRALWFDEATTTYARGATNSFSLYVHGTRCLHITMQAGAPSDTFRIVGMAATNGAYVLHVPRGYASYRAQTCDDVKEQEWADCESAQAESTWTYPANYADPDLAGATVPTVALTVQADPPATGRRFWRVIADDGAELAGSAVFPVAVAAPAGVLLRSPGGNWFRLKVANDGTLSTEAADPPAE